MRYLFLLILIFASITDIKADNWEKIDLPTSNYYQYVYDSDYNDKVFQSVDSLPPYKSPEPYLADLQAAFISHGADPAYINRIVTIHPFENVLFSLSEEGLALYSHDNGQTWKLSDVPDNAANLHDNMTWESFGEDIYFLPESGANLLVSHDSCISWSVYNDDLIYELEKINDSTLFYGGRKKYSDYSYNVYRNFKTNRVDSTKGILDWSSSVVEVNGDTIFVFNYTEEVYRSTDRGHSWNLWLDMRLIHSKCDSYCSTFGLGYSARDDLFISYCQDGNHHVISPDAGETWFNYSYSQIDHIAGECFFKKGYYNKYNIKTDIAEEIFIDYAEYGSYRLFAGKKYYINQDGRRSKFRPNNQSVWLDESSIIPQRYITKSGIEYYLNSNSELFYNQGSNQKLIAGNISSFQFISESDKIDILTYNVADEEQQTVVFLQDGKVIFSYAAPEKDIVLASVDSYDSNKLYYIEKVGSQANLLIYNKDTHKTDSHLLPLNIPTEDLFTILSYRSKVFLIGVESIFISEDDGATFMSVENPNAYKHSDLLYNNAQLHYGELFIAGSKGLLMLNEELNWENLLKDESNTYVFGVEFLENKIYAYTESGLLVKEAPNSVSLEKQKRAAVYEYRTGIHALSVPVVLYESDHFIQTFSEEKPDQICVINYHINNGSSYPRNDEEPDLRTESADLIADYLGIDVDRSIAINRDTLFNLYTQPGWGLEDHSEEIKQEVEASLEIEAPVNLNVFTEVNPETRMLRTEVSYYFTSESKGDLKLCVYLLQDNIKTPLTSNFFYLNQTSVDGKYYLHNVFRMSLTDEVLGDTIESSTEGRYGKNIYKAVLPEYIRNTKLDLSNIKVVAFIQKDASEVLNATSARVEMPEENKVYLSLENQTDTSKYFFDYFKPRVKVTNNGSTDVSQFDLHFVLNDSIYTKRVYQNLPHNKSITVEFDSIPVEYGNFYYAFFGFDNINNSDETEEYFADFSPEDNEISIEGLRLKRDAYEFAKFDFKNSAEKSGYGFVRRLGSEEGLIIYGRTRALSGTTSLSANNATAWEYNTMFFSSKESESEAKTEYLFFGEVDLTSKEKAFLSYYYALDGKNTNGDDTKYDVEFSSDGGASWKLLNEFAPEETFTGYDKKTYYRDFAYGDKQYVSLKECLNKKVIVRFAVHHGTSGNHFFLDEVQISDTIPTIASSIDRIDFSKVTLYDGVYVDQTIEIRNIGLDDLKIDTMKIRGVNFDSFSLLDAVADSIIPVGESIELTVRFAPEAETDYLANLEIHSNDPEHKIHFIRLDGEGVGTSIEGIENNLEFNISPNPATEYLNINYSSEINELEIIDMFGHIYTIEVANNNIDISHLPAGSYFLKAKSGSKTYFKKFVVVR